MRSKTLLIVISLVAAFIVLGSVFAGGIIIGRNLPLTAIEPTKTVVSVMPAVGILPTSTPTESMLDLETPVSENDSTPQDLKIIFKPFWEAWQFVHDQYVDQPVDDVAMMRGAIEGMLKSLGDQHTSYITPDELLQDQMSMEGEYEGIGAWVDTQAEFLTIISPMPGSPAEAAGLKPGDQVITINGEDMTGIDGGVVVRKVLGPEGTKVTLTIRREGVEKPLEFTITRAKITLPSVESKMLDKDIAYVQVITFGKTTDSDLYKALQDLLSKNPKGLILDLRGNPGGLLQTAIDVASEFIRKGVIMYEDYGNGFRQEYKAKGNGLATDIPMVVLINEGSASASEIVAGAIQDYQRGALVGMTSFGKSAVQNWIPLSDDQGGVRITIARWLTPKEHTIHEVGIKPDYEVKLTEEDFKAKRDPQLDKAIEILLKNRK
ncbi:MAG: S41 family peptidase [Anaerolineales bacterium]|nr:S41 family peptidase [Anaerolineales bacterium]